MWNFKSPKVRVFWIAANAEGSDGNRAGSMSVWLSFWLWMPRDDADGRLHRPDRMANIEGGVFLLQREGKEYAFFRWIYFGGGREFVCVILAGSMGKWPFTLFIGGLMMLFLSGWREMVIFFYSCLMIELFGGLS